MFNKVCKLVKRDRKLHGENFEQLAKKQYLEDHQADNATPARKRKLQKQQIHVCNDLVESDSDEDNTGGTTDGASSISVPV